MPVSTSDIDRIGVSSVRIKTHRQNWIFREQLECDHGIDAHIELRHEGQPTGRLIALQIKTGDSYFTEENADGYVFRDAEHLRYWLDHSLSVIVVIVRPDSEEAFWQKITPETIVETGKGWKTTIPKHQTYSSEAFRLFVEMAVKGKIRRPYSMLGLEDKSIAGAKRYAQKILLTGDFPRFYLESLSAEITQDTTRETWIEKPRLRELFGNRKADVIWLYFFRTIDDAAQYNVFFRTQWISPDLNPKFRPCMINPDVPAGTLEFHWSEYRDALEDFSLEREVGKDEAVKSAIALVRAIDTHIEKWLSVIQKVIERNIEWDSAKKLLREAANQANEIYQNTDLPIPPYELEDIYQTLENTVALFDNIFLPYGEMVEKTMTWESAWGITNQALREFMKQRPILDEKAEAAHITLS